MLKRLEVQHFKSLDDFRIDFEPFTVLIGQNGSGKTTVLQVLDLLGAFLKGDINHHLKELGWNYASSLSSKVSEQLGFHFALYFEAEGIHFCWKVSFSPSDYGLKVLSEELVVVDEHLRAVQSGFRFRSFAEGEFWTLEDAAGQPLDLPALKIDFKQSILRAFKIKDAPAEIEIAARQLERIFLYCQDSTETLRKESMYQQGLRQIGRNGEMLAAYLYALMEREEIGTLSAQLSKFIPQIKAIKATNLAGRISFSIVEEFPSAPDPDKRIEIFQDHINEGTLRLLSLLAMIHSLPQGAIVLLDEIENAVDPNRLGTLVEFLESQIEAKGIQLILATHSPVILNYTLDTGIRYLSRTASGNTVSTNPFDNSALKEMLAYMNPGEVWLNLTEEDLRGGK